MPENIFAKKHPSTDEFSITHVGFDQWKPAMINGTSAIIGADGASKI